MMADASDSKKCSPEQAGRRKAAVAAIQVEEGVLTLKRYHLYKH